MKKCSIILLLAFLLAPLVSSAQKKDEVTGALLIKTTKTKEVQPAPEPTPEPVPTPAPATNINKNLFLMGEAGFMVSGAGLAHDFMFTAGYRFKERFVIGGGLGYFGKYDNAYPGFILYGYGRADILKNRKITPFVSLYLGGNIPWGVYISPMAGVKLPISQSIKLNISTGFVAATVQEHCGERWTTSNWSLRVGVEF